jgi:spermidine synthase
LYAANTAGGVLGILLATQCWLWWWGARGTIVTALALNVLVAAGCYWLDLCRDVMAATPPAEDKSAARGQPVETRSAARPAEVQASPLGLGRGLSLAFFSGVGVLAVEVLCIHLFAHVLSTFTATAAVLVGFVGLLFVSAAAFPLLTPRFVSPRRLITPLMCVTAVAVSLLPAQFMSVTDDLQRTYEGFGNTLAFVGAVMISMLATAGPAVFAAGLVFPLAVSCVPAAGPRVLRHWGWAIAVNGLGGASGAMLISHVALTRLGLYQSFAVVAALYALIPIVLAIGDRWSRSWPVVCGGVATITAVWLVSAIVLPGLPLIVRQDTARVLAVDSGPDGVITVVERMFELPGGRQVSRSLVWDNQYTLGGTLSRYDEQRQALLPLLLHPHPRSVAFLGLATGITAGTALDVPGVEQVTAVELSPQVVRCARAYFADFNRGICDHPRARVIVEDARTYVAACADQFDVVVADLFRPFATGEGRLFTVEHCQAVKASLRAGGLYAHWLPCHQLSQEEFEVALASFLQVFPQAEIWRVNFKSQLTAIGLFGFKEGQLSFAGLAARCRMIREQGKILDPPSRHPESIAMHYVGRLTPGDIQTTSANTLENMWLELHCGLRHCLQQSFATSLTNANWMAFEEQLYQRAGRHPDAAGALSPWRAVGRKIVRWYHVESCQPRDEAVVRRLREDAQRSLPQSLQEDDAADWTFWPLL